MRESEQVAAIRTVLGKCLAGHRERNGLKQSDLAERLYYDRTSIAKIETGQQPALRAFWIAADELVGAHGELVAMFDRLTMVKAADSQTYRRSEGHVSQQSADVLADALTAVTLPVARASNRIRSTSACLDQVDTVIELEALSRALAEHSRRVLKGESADWAEIADRLSTAATTCRHRVVVEPCAVGDTARN